MTDTALSDHFAINMSINMAKPQNSCKEVTYRKVNNICIQDFRHDLDQLLASLTPTTDKGVDELVELYNISLQSLLDTNAPEQSLP